MSLVQVIQKELSLKELKSIIEELDNKLQLKLELKKINFEKTQPQSSKIKDVLVNKSNFVFDRFTHYVIKDEEYDTDILATHQSLLSYQECYLKEIERMRKYDDIALIVYLRDEEKLAWRTIDKILNFGEDYSRTKYRRYKDDKKINNQDKVN